MEAGRTAEEVGREFGVSKLLSSASRVRRDLPLLLSGLSGGGCATRAPVIPGKIEVASGKVQVRIPII